MSSINGSTSQTYSFTPDLSDWIVEAFERIQIRAPALDDPSYIISARRSANLICLDLAANRGANLWLIGDEPLAIPMVAGKPDHLLPDNTIQIFDSYRRQFTPGIEFTQIGFAPQVMVQANGTPMLTAQGEPMVIAPGSGVFSIVAGSQYATMNWPAHGRAPGDPIFFHMPVTCGPMSLTNFVIVSSIIDSNNFAFLLPSPALATNIGTGGTPLFVSHSGLSSITVVMSYHGLVVGNQFPISVATDVGGLTLDTGLYTINEIIDPHQFSIATVPQAPLDAPLFILGSSGLGQGVLGDDPGVWPQAPFTESVFENGGRLLVTSQAPNVLYNDVIMTGISRTDYSGLPNKTAPGTPSVFWYDRAETPGAHKQRVFLWSAASPGSTLGFICFRMRYMEDAETDAAMQMPRRMLPAFTAMLTAALAEKYKPQMFQEKLQLAEALWDRAANSDSEYVNMFIRPELSSYFR